MTELTSHGLKAPSPRLFIVHASEDEWFVKGFLLPAVGLSKEEVLFSTKLSLGSPIVADIAYRREAWECRAEHRAAG